MGGCTGHGVELYCASAKCMNIGSMYVALLESMCTFNLVVVKQLRCSVYLFVAYVPYH